MCRTSAAASATWRLRYCSSTASRTAARCRCRRHRRAAGASCSIGMTIRGRPAVERGKTPSAIKQLATRLGLDSGRYYTPEELQVVRELYKSHSAGAIAERLYGDARRLNRVRKIAETLGLFKWPRWPAEVLERVRACHAEGLHDRQIAERMADVFAAGAKGRLAVKEIRKCRLKLPDRKSTR